MKSGQRFVVRCGGEFSGEKPPPLAGFFHFLNNFFAQNFILFRRIFFVENVKFFADKSAAGEAVLALEAISAVLERTRIDDIGAEFDVVAFVLNLCGIED